MASRAHLLAGLRTGGPRSSSPFEGDRFEQEQSSPRPNNASSNTVTLKANAAPFTPNKRQSASAAKNVDEQAAAFRMQQVLAAATSQRQASYAMGEDFAAMYGASQGQPQQVDYHQKHDVANLIRQKQAQLLQNQMLAQQQQQQQQQQMEMYRLQAASQQQQHLQQVAVQQRLLLAQMQAEYNNQQQQQHSAQDQRMSAQASLQASIRQRQAEQMYAQLMEQQQGQQIEDAQVQQQQQLLQRLQLLQFQAAAMQGMQDMSFGDESPQAMSTPIRRNGTPRADSPSIAAQQNRRDRQASQTAADNATSWRSTPTSLSKASSKVNAGRKTPSIVVDDSGSEKSDAETSNCEDNETPETSEEDISSGVNALAKEVSQRLSVVEKREPSKSPSPRPLTLSQAPRTRAFSTEVKTTSLSVNGANIASRQPRGPPTEFLSINFTSRLSARTRREAMSKLCASPRAATFNIVPRSAVVA